MNNKNEIIDLEALGSQPECWVCQGEIRAVRSEIWHKYLFRKFRTLNYVLQQLWLEKNSGRTEWRKIPVIPDKGINA